MCLVPQTYKRQETSNDPMWPETDAGSELPLTSFKITQPGRAAAIVSQPILHHIRETEWKRETA